MPSTAKEPKHVHKYKRLTYKTGSSIFFCTLPDCTNKIKTPLALGKSSLCWRCGEVFIINEYSIRLAKPHCENCHKSKSDIARVHIQDLSDETIKQLPTESLIDRMKRLANSKEEDEEL